MLVGLGTECSMAEISCNTKDLLKTAGVCEVGSRFQSKQGAVCDPFMSVLFVSKFLCYWMFSKRLKYFLFIIQ